MTVHAVHASYLHWSKVGTTINLQRGYCLLSHIYAVTNNADMVIYYAQKCMDLTEKHKFVEYDLAYAYEAMARSYALQSNRKKCEEFVHRTIEAGKKIKNDEDKDLFFSGLKVRPWFGCDGFYKKLTKEIKIWVGP